MRGVIGVLTGKGPACDELQGWIDRQPRDVRVDRMPGNQIAWQRNEIVRQMEPDEDFVLYVDNDCIPPAEALQHLYSVSAVSGIAAGACLERVLPFDICAVKSLEPYSRYTPADLLTMTGATPVIAAGTGCMLIRRDVFRDLKEPWFRCGQIHPELLAEDLDFCLRAAEVGHPTYLVPSVKVGHRTDVILWPGDDGMRWAQWPEQRGRAPYRTSLPMNDERETHEV